ncbi:hypothetical protein KBD69_03005 [Candidatus Woesebacteria bacterium]|nr:hypothetical protein [Candidatus Woesebacteria bacterium]
MGHPIKDNLIALGLGASSIIGIGSDVVSQSPYRELLPDIYQEQAGNFGIPWCLGVIINLTGRFLELRGNNENSQDTLELGQKIRNYGNVFIIGVLFGVEGQFINNIELLKENSLDFAMGILAITIGISAGKKIAEAVMGQSNTNSSPPSSSINTR